MRRRKPRAGRAPDPSHTGREAGAGLLSVKYLLRAQPETWEHSTLAPRDREELARQLDTALASDADEVRVSLPHRRGRTFTMARPDAAALLADLERARATGANVTAALRGTLTGAPPWAAIGHG